MKKIIDLIAGSGSHKDEKLLNYIRKNYLIKNNITNLCFISGQGEDYDYEEYEDEIDKDDFDISM